MTDVRFETRPGFEDKEDWTEIKYRIRDPEDFDEDSFRRIKIKKDTPKVFGIIGKLKDEDSTTMQALRFPKEPPDNWTLAKAKTWVADNPDIKDSRDIGSLLIATLEPFDVNAQAVTFDPEKPLKHFFGRRLQELVNSIERSKN